MSQPVVVAHGAHTAWRLRRYRAILKLLPNVVERKDHQLAGTLLVVLIAVGGSLGGGMVIDGYVIQHPLVLVGECPIPLVLNANGCFSSLTIHETVNGKNVTTTELIPAGTIVFPNGSKFP